MTFGYLEIISLYYFYLLWYNLWNFVIVGVDEVKNLKVNKRLVSLLVAGVISLSPVGFKNSAKAEEISYVVANTKLNVRRDSNVDGERITTIDEGTTLVSLGYLDNGWYQVLYNGEIAYVCGDYVSSFSRMVRDNQEVVRANRKVNVFKKATDESEKVGSIDKGVVLDYVQTLSNGWHKVIYDGEEAYVSSSYTKVEKEGLHNETVLVVTAIKDVNIRDYDHTDCRIIGVLQEGDSLICDEVLDNGWYQVKYNGTICYVFGGNVFPEYKQMITNDVAGLLSMKEDSFIYEDSNLTIPIGYIPEYELGHIHNIGDTYYLISSECGSGYIPKSSAEKLGDAVVVVDVSSQVMTLYNDSIPRLHGSIITGKPETPSHIGLFKIYGKSRDKNLKGLESNHVDYWMPYNGGEGLHDAKWQKNFGGETYKKRGSHGCINMPKDLARELYGEVEIGTQVLVKR